MSIELKRILLIEDDPHDAELTLKALEELQLVTAVDWARDGEEALHYLFWREHDTQAAEYHPVVILLDLKLPKVNGLEILRTVKANEALRFIPVVVFTSSREERDLIESYRLGTSAYVVKPVDFSEFSRAIKELSVFWAILNEPPPDGLLDAEPN